MNKKGVALAVIGGVMLLMVLSPAVQAAPSHPCSLTATSPQGKVVHRNVPFSQIDERVARMTEHGYTDIFVDCK